MSFGFAAPRVPTPILLAETAPLIRPATAAAPAEAELPNLAGRVALPGDTAEIRALFPAAARLWPLAPLRALLATTTLVGMVCPGLHSLFAALELHLGDTSGDPEALGFRVTNADPRTRLVQLQVAGSGLHGTLDSFRRIPPVAMPAMAALSGRVAPGAYAGSTALVVGASRGLGELAAKLLAAGGARVLGTYATGADDAARVAGEINAAGFHCRILPYDVRLPPAPQLGAEQPSHLYYFATPPISRHTGGVFSPARLNNFLAFYVTGFHDLLLHLLAGAPTGIAAFYPSSI